MKTRIRQLILLASLTGAAVAAWAQAPTTEGEVRKIDPAQQKITLKHGEIKNLDMPPMTMAFRMKDAALLSQFAVGDRVRFTVEKVDGAYTVTQIQKAN
ncbi:copper-binding protein [Ideonella sp. BN130291]|uniref:copper-binding protein n=1 Tax=Ideonella sp. BN130291 TaxID=3112940 RepID=UPI002E25E818|nr:copper-binding protein [Ideonella sp. BN130291]